MNATVFNKLLYRITKKDSEALLEIYKYFRPKIIAHILYKYRDRKLGEDVAHDFFKMLLTKKSFDYIEKPLGWVYSICENNAKNYIAKFSKEIPSSDLLNNIAATESITNTTITYAEFKSENLEKIKDLDDITQKIVIEHVFAKTKLKDIAVQLGMEYSAVRQRYKRAMDKLKKSFKNF